MQTHARQYIDNALKGVSDWTTRAEEKEARTSLVQRINDISASNIFKRLFPEVQAAVDKLPDNRRRVLSNRSLQTLLESTERTSPFYPKERLQWLQKVFAVWCEDRDAVDFPGGESM